MVSAVIVAAGRGTRMAGDRPKQFLTLYGRSILAHTLAVFDRCPDIDAIRLVVPEWASDEGQRIVTDGAVAATPCLVVAGGPTRQESVFNGLCAAPRDTRLVAIHDGVRPFVPADRLRQCIRTAGDTGACMLGIPAFDTLKTVDAAGVVTATLPRQDVWLAQTPQVFRMDWILQAHKVARNSGTRATDDAALMERAGYRVTVIPGSRLNIKITTPEDLALARAIRRAMDAETLPGNR